MRIKRLDPAFLSTPAIALGQAKREILNMADIVTKMLDDAIKVFENKDNPLRKKIVDADDEVDLLEETITPYLTKISEKEIDSYLSHQHSLLLGAVTELEHIGDVVSKSLMTYAKKQISSGLVFSHEGLSEIEELHKFSLSTLRTSIDALTTDNRTLAKSALARKEVGYQKAKDLNNRHLDRLKRGLKKSLETSAIHLDLISDLERINFHASVIAEGLL
jgi:phosphate:Na+ symporter